MSGGHFDYKNDDAGKEIFGWYLDINYGLDRRQEDAKKAAKMNPLEDREISELAYDLFCLLHSFDWYKSGDTGIDDYREDLAFFKKKWLERSGQERVHFLVERAIDRIKKQSDEEIADLKRMEAQNER